MVSRLEALARRAQGAPSQELLDAWLVFAMDLETDLALRERRVTAQAHRGLAHREHARTVTQEHAAARTLVDEIGRELVRRRPRATTFELLADILRGRVVDDDVPRS